MFILIHNSNIFMHWTLDSIKFGSRNAWDARETADTAQWARLFRPGLADELGFVLGLGSFISGKEILYRTLFSSPLFCSRMTLLPGYHLSSSRITFSHNWGCLVTSPLCVPLTGIWNPSMDSLSALSRHPLTASASSTNRKLYFQNFKTSTEQLFFFG